MLTLSEEIACLSCTSLLRFVIALILSASLKFKVGLQSKDRREMLLEMLIATYL